MEITLALEFDAARPRYLQLYECLKEGISSERFTPGLRLPSSRELARSLGVSRITVTECYERLKSEGFLEPRRGSGTFVCKAPPEARLYALRASAVAPPEHNELASPRLSRFGSAADRSLHRLAPPGVLRLDRHGPDISKFPRSVWARLAARRMQSADPRVFGYGEDFRGDPRLRALIADYLRRARAVVCDPDQILLVNGSQQAIHLSTIVLLNEGDAVAMESPGYYGAGMMFAAHGARIIPIPVDKHGLVVAAMPCEEDVRLLYVTPSHQFPTGSALSTSRRKALVAWARKHNALIFEDDYDSEFRYSERPLPSLQGIAGDSPVIYTGTFSKMLFPSLRLAYMVLPKALLTAFRTAKVFTDLQCSSFHQQIVADFLEEGHLESHLRRMRVLYEGRRNNLIGSLTHHFGDSVSILGAAAGMYLLARFKSRFSEQEAWQRAFEAGVRLEQCFWPDGQHHEEPGHVQFVLAYGSTSERQLQVAARRLATAWS